jgi:hypothetical protein
MEPGETFATPALHLAQVHADLDDAVQALCRHVRASALRPQLPGKHQRIEANQRGYIVDHEDEAGLKREVGIAAGGGRLYLGKLRNLRIIEMSDWARAPRTIKRPNGISLHLPPETCLRVFGTGVPDSHR